MWHLIDKLVKTKQNLGRILQRNVVSKFWMIAHGSVQIFMLDKVTADIQGKKKIYFNRSRLKEKSAETMSEFTKHCWQNTMTGQQKTKLNTRKWNRTIGAIVGEMRQDEIEKHYGTYSTFNNKARWQSLRYQGQGEPGEEAGRMGAKQGEGCREGSRLNNLGTQERIITSLWEVNKETNRETECIGILFNKSAALFSFYISRSSLIFPKHDLCLKVS